MGSINKQLIEDIRGEILPAQIVQDDDDDEEEDWDANRVKNRQRQVQRSKGPKRERHDLLIPNHQTLSHDFVEILQGFFCDRCWKVFLKGKDF